MDLQGTGVGRVTSSQTVKRAHFTATGGERTDSKARFGWMGEYSPGAETWLRARMSRESVFLQRDSAYVESTLLGLNRYLFANGNPIRYADPSGHEVLSSSEFEGDATFLDEMFPNSTVLDMHSVAGRQGEGLNVVWDGNIYRPQELADALAEAGGLGDQIVCIICNGGVRSNGQDAISDVIAQRTGLHTIGANGEVFVDAAGGRVYVAMGVPPGVSTELIPPGLVKGIGPDGTRFDLEGVELLVWGEPGSIRVSMPRGPDPASCGWWQRARGWVRGLGRAPWWLKAGAGAIVEEIVSQLLLPARADLPWRVEENFFQCRQRAVELGQDPNSCRAQPRLTPPPPR